MPRLKSLGSPVATIGSSLGYAAGDERGRDKRRRETQPWRAWYKTARWERLRREIFVRDLYTCQRTGVLCSGSGNDPNAPVANHKVPHRGDPRLFWDPANLETVTKAVHDSIIQAEEAAGHR